MQKAGRSYRRTSEECCRRKLAGVNRSSKVKVVRTWRSKLESGNNTERAFGWLYVSYVGGVVGIKDKDFSQGEMN